MKRSWMFLTVVALASALVASWAFGQEEGGPRRRPAGSDRPARAGRPDRPGMGRPGMMRGRRPGLGGVPLPRIPDLTPEQRKQIARVQQDAAEQIRKIREKALDDIRKLLNPEQAKAFDEGRRRFTHRGPDPGVILTDEQKRIFDDARAEAAKAEDFQARGKTMRAAIEKIRASYTEDQKRRAAEFRKRLGDRRGGLDRQGGPDRPGQPGDRPRRPRRPAPENVPE